MAPPENGKYTILFANEREYQRTKARNIKRIREADLIGVMLAGDIRLVKYRLGPTRIVDSVTWANLVDEAEAYRADA